MAEIKAIYEEHKHRYSYQRITLELRHRNLLVNYKRLQCLMGKLKLFGILKQEMFYGFETQFKNLNKLEKGNKKYISYYDKQRIKAKLKELTPLE